MQRVRRNAALPVAAIGRAAAACAVSAALHALLIFGVVLPVRPGSGEHAASIIHARIAVSHAPIEPTIPAKRRKTRADLPYDAAPVNVPHEPVVETVPEIAPMPPAEALAPQAKVDSDTVASLVDPVHYTARDLDVYPRAVRPIRPSYPQAAGDAPAAGFVTLSVKIDEGGRVLETTVVDATVDPAFGIAAQEAVAGTPFSPAQREGRSVRSQVLIRIEFDPARP